jgi:glycosyltransferase involved in cell wall biosynthesis
MSEMESVEVRFIGRWAKEVDPRRVVLLGTKTAPAIAEAMRDSDVIVHAALNEPCSNSLIEGLACGLPALYRDSGGNRELAGEYGIPLGEMLTESVAMIRARYTELREKLIEERNRFLIEHAAAQYVTAFEKAVELRAKACSGD